MQLSRREQVIFIIVGALASVFMLDRLVVSPAWRWRQDLADRRETLVHEVRSAAMLIDQGPIFEQQWNMMTGHGLPATGSDAEGQAYHAVRDGAQASGLRLESINPERVISDSVLPTIVFRTTGTGSMRAVADFLKQLDASTLAIRIEQLQIAARRDGEDDLRLELRLSTIFSPERAPPLDQENAS